MRFDFLLDDYELGFDHGMVRRFDVTNLCDDPRGVSGTEVNVLGLAEALARLGHQVRLFSRYTDGGTTYCYHDGGTLAYVPLELGRAGDADVAVAFHDTRKLDTWPAAFKIAWHQTLTPPFHLRMADEPVDLYISATERNANHLAQYTCGKPWAVVPNGWDFGPYQPHTPVPGRLFYHTSPERGLHVLLRALPEIRRRVPEAHLVVWTRMHSATGHHPAIEREIRERLAECAAYVELHPDGGSRREVLASLATAACVAYPSEPPMPCEVMPVSLMEALATGVPVVTAPSDGFEEAFPRALQCTAAPASRHIDQFIDMIDSMLTYPPHIQMMKYRGLAWAAQHTFAHTAQRFLAVVADHLRQKETVHA